MTARLPRLMTVLCLALGPWVPAFAPSARAAPDPTAAPTGDGTAAKQAFARFSAGEALFKDARFAQAAAAFEEAWGLFADPAYCFNAGLAHEKAEHWAAARAWYERLLAAYPALPNRAEAEAHLAAVRARPGLPATAPAKVSHTGSWVAWTAGGVALVAGAALGGVALGRYDDAKALAARGPLDDADWGRFRSLQRQVRGWSLGADLAFGAALTGAIVGVVLWVTAGPEAASEVGVHAGAGGATWSF